jgi:hypothetical protein
MPTYLPIANLSISSLQMSSRVFERLRVDIISSVLHSDVSWGTKGDNKGETSNKGHAIEVAVPTVETDINAAYENAIHVLSTKPPKEEKRADATTIQEDLFRSFWAKYVVYPSFLL